MSTRPRSSVDANMLRQLNSGIVLRALATMQEQFTVADLVERTGLSRRPIEEILLDLTDQGWVGSTDASGGPARPGRPPRRFVFRADHALLASISIGMHTVAVIVTDIRGVVLGDAERPLADYFDPDACVGDAIAALHDALERIGRVIGDVRAGAVASGGAIDASGAVRHLYNAPMWTDFPLAGRLATAARFPFLADNNANLAGLAEGWRGAAEGERDYVWAVLGSRVGLGIIIDGRIYRGVAGAAGELVETAVFDFDDLKRQPIAWLTSSYQAERSVALDLVDLALNGHDQSILLIDEYVEKVLPAIITLAWIIAPPILILGGGLEPAGPLLAPRIQSRLEAVGLEGISVRTGGIGERASVYGGIRAILDGFDHELFGPTLIG